MRTVTRAAALVGAALVTLSPMLIFYSTEARAYALMTTLALGSTLALLQALERRQAGWWIAYAALSCAGLYTHYTVVFVLVAQFAWAFATRRAARRALLAASAAAAVAFLPWWSEFLKDSNSACARLISALQPFNVTALRTDVGRWCARQHGPAAALRPRRRGARARRRRLRRGSGRAGGGVARNGGVSLPRDRRGLILVLVLALATPVGAALYSALRASLFIPRNLIASWPALALTAGVLVSGGGPLRRYAATGLLLAAFAIAGIQMLARDYQRPDYAAAVSFLERAAPPGAQVVEAPFPTPGPLTPLSVAFDQAGDAASGSAIISLAAPPIAAQLAARAPGGGGACVALPVASPQAVAAVAARRSAGRPVFLVALGDATVAQLRAQPASPLGAFIAALPPRYRPAGHLVLPGVAPLSVYEFAAT